MVRSTGTVVTVAIFVLLVGMLVSYALFPREVEVVKTITEKVPVEVEKIVELKVVEDIKEAYLLQAIQDVLTDLDDDDLFECNGDDYDLDEVNVNKIYDAFSVTYLDDDKYEVSGKVRLNFKQDDEKRCRDVLDFTVTYEEGEDPVVVI